MEIWWTKEHFERNTPYVGRLVDELTILYKEAAMKRAREEVRTHILQILTLLQQAVVITAFKAIENLLSLPFHFVG
nr:hypothetical protein CFP56_44207 [Quercus suber]